VTSIRASRAPDLWALVGLALAGLAVALVPSPGWLRAVLLTPLVLLLPGYALAAALFPPGRIKRLDRAAYAISLSIALTVLGGLLLQLVLPLGRVTWAVLLVLLTVGTSARALIRRQPGEHPRLRLRAPARLTPAILSSVLLLAAVALAAGSVAIAQRGVEAHWGDAHFTSLSTQPHESRGRIDSLVIQVSNREGRNSRYRLHFSRGRRPAGDLRLDLDAGQKWRTTVPLAAIPGKGPIGIWLYRQGDVYRHTRVDLRGQS
jgi:Protein of unknown function (DUF1616)